MERRLQRQGLSGAFSGGFSGRLLWNDVSSRYGSTIRRRDAQANALMRAEHPSKLLFQPIHKVIVADRPACERTSLQHSDLDQLLGRGRRRSPAISTAFVSLNAHVEKAGWVVTAQMRGRTGPPERVRVVSESGPHRILLYIAHRDPGMPGVERTRVEAILPQMAGSAAPRVQIIRRSAWTWRKATASEPGSSGTTTK